MPGELVTMRDIARLAHVARPVVTTWRRRFRSGADQFPGPHRQDGSQVLFSREDVVAWLERTAHGNNTDARSEASTDALLSDPRLDTPRTFDALSALLTMRGLLGEPLTDLDPDELVDAAEGLDPDDTFVFGEIRRAPDPAWLVRAADDLVDACWGVGDAHDQLLARLPALTAGTMLSPDARRALVSLTAPLLRELGPDATLLDVTGCRFDVTGEIATATGARVAVLGGTSRSHRLTRRRLRLAQLTPAVIDPEGGWQSSGPTLNLAVLPDGAHPTASDAHQLALIDDVITQLGPGQALLVMAPAKLLTDRLDGSESADRDRFLREGVVRAIVRLPAGLVPGRVREASALWLVVRDEATSPAERRTLVGDLSGSWLSPELVSDLASDLLASFEGVEGARRRAWRHLHPVLTAGLLAAGGSLTATGPAPGRTVELTTGVDWVVRLGGSTPEQLPGWRLEAADGSPERVTLAAAQQRGWLRIMQGRKFDAGGLRDDEPGAPVPVWDAAAVADPSARSTVDRLVLHALIDPVFTEPGDVVFVNRPRPRAVLDTDGGAAVCAPVRILRVRAGGLVPAMLAARINAQSSTDHRAWTFATVRDPDATAAALAQLDARREQLLAELAGHDRFTSDLITAAESRRLSIKENNGQAVG